MSKTIIVPDGMNPFRVTINCAEYSYPSDTEQEVPDEVAAAIEDALALAPKPDKNLSKVAQIIEGSITEINEKDMAGIKVVGSYSFYNCDKLTKVVVPDGAVNIEAYAFAYCEALTQVVLPESVTSINGRAFAESSNLTSIVLKAVVPPAIREDTIGAIPKSCIFKVPKGSLEAYKAANLWSQIADQITAIEE